MFSGIVEDTGRLAALAPASSTWRLEVDAAGIADGVAVGDSVAVNGCCLTAVRAGSGRLAFDLLEETLRLTHFSRLPVGARLNLERSLKVGDRIGGHFVTGHIDAVGEIATLEPRGLDRYLRIRVPDATARYLIYKGSIAVDGVSLTVAEVTSDSFSVWLIPHTLSVTDLGEKRAGDPVNLEFDMLGKYVEKLLSTRSS
jgi:riboflavin synthase